MPYLNCLSKKDRNQLQVKIAELIPTGTAAHNIRVFYRVYEIMASYGLCDSPGGSEYKRVLAEWHEAGLPYNLAEFIYQSANRLIE